MSAAATDTGRSVVRSLLIPLGGDALLVPGTVVAEVAPMSAPVPVNGGPAWLLGLAAWRGHSIPLIVFERLLFPDAPANVTRRSRMLIFNALGGSPALPFYGVLSQGIPRLLVADAETLTPLPAQGPEASGVLSRVSVENDNAVIPDLDVLERKLLELNLGARP